MPVFLAFPLSLIMVLWAATASAQTPPDAPLPHLQAVPQSPASVPKTQTESPCQIKRDGIAFMQAAASGAVAQNPSSPPLSPNLEPSSCPPFTPLIDWYARFLNGPQVKPLTPREKGVLAIRNFVDPFNGVTIAANSAIYIGANSHTWYGPGFSGWAKHMGISYSEDGIDEFFGTFLIPSIARQDPHYHRMPEASVAHRIIHAITQVAWTQGDDGREMLNYANLAGFAIDGQLFNLYVPDIHTNAPATASRYLIALGTAPAENLVTEFIPDVARHIHLRVVIVQRIIDQVSRGEGGP